MSNNLKPCPFCGGEATIREHSFGHRGTGEFVATYRIGCRECNIEFVRESVFRLVDGKPTFIQDGFKECFDLWNRRASDE